MSGKFSCEEGVPKPIYSLRKIEFSRGNTFNLKVERLDMLAGCLYALVGPNGAGKSSLLSVLAMLTPPGRGELQFAGTPVGRNESSLKRLRRQVTLVTQSPYLFSGTVYSNLAYGLRLRGIWGDEQRRRIALALINVGLDGFEQRRSQELSGGEIQRVALARALVLGPKVLLLDESTSNIDHESLQVFEKLIKTLPNQGITVVFSTHDPDQPRRLGAETILLNEGRLVAAPRTATGQPHVEGTENLLWPRPLKTPEPSF